MSKPFKVSADYIEWAHRPGAESGQKLAEEICALPTNKRGQVEIPADRLDMLREVASVAELYVGGDGSDLRAARVLSRVRDAIAKAKA